MAITYGQFVHNVCVTCGFLCIFSLVFLCFCLCMFLFTFLCHSFFGFSCCFMGIAAWIKRNEWMNEITVYKFKEKIPHRHRTAVAMSSQSRRLRRSLLRHVTLRVDSALVGACLWPYVTPWDFLCSTFLSPASTVTLTRSFSSRSSRKLDARAKKRCPKNAVLDSVAGFLRVESRVFYRPTYYRSEDVWSFRGLSIYIKRIFTLKFRKSG